MPGSGDACAGSLTRGSRRQPREMDLGNMRHLGVRGLAVHCLNPKCRHQVVFSADDYPDEVEVPTTQPLFVVVSEGFARLRGGVVINVALYSMFAQAPPPVT
jgi:hypothetical protein